MADPAENPEQAPEDEPSPKGASIGAKGRRSLSKSRRELTEEELAQSGVRLMLLDEVDRLDTLVTRLQSYEDRFHEAETEIAVLREKRQRDITIDVVHGVCVGFGVGFLMLVPTLSGSQGWFAGAVGTVLVVAAIVLKARGR